MTKPVTGVAMMILYEEGKWLPSDPIAKYIPEFAHLKVFNGLDANGKMILVDPDHAPTMRELMTHTAGFTYGDADTPVDKMVHESEPSRAQTFRTGSIAGASPRCSISPAQGWVYSPSMDVQGYIVEKLSGQSLPDFMRDQIFTPLGMSDAGFYVLRTSAPDSPPLYTRRRRPAGRRSHHQRHSRRLCSQPTKPSGGGGLVSTAEDYYRFAQMLLNNGQSGGKRILAPATVKLMTSNHVPARCSPANSASARTSCAPASATATTAPWSSIRR